MLAGLISVSTLAVTAWYGGELVYRHGLGVMALPKASDHTHAKGTPAHSHGKDAPAHSHDKNTPAHSHGDVSQPEKNKSNDATPAKGGASSDGHDHTH